MARVSGWLMQADCAAKYPCGYGQSRERAPAEGGPEAGDRRDLHAAAGYASASAGAKRASTKRTTTGTTRTKKTTTGTTTMKGKMTTTMTTKMMIN